MILRNIKTLLEDKYQVIPVNSSEMAIKYLALNIPDLILLDYEMPIVDGRQFMQMIREDTEFQNIPIIFLTGKNDAQTVMDVMSLKPNGYLLKAWMRRNCMLRSMISLKARQNKGCSINNEVYRIWKCMIPLKQPGQIIPNCLGVFMYTKR